MRRERVEGRRRSPRRSERAEHVERAGQTCGVARAGVAQHEPGLAAAPFLVESESGEHRDAAGRRDAARKRRVPGADRAHAREARLAEDRLHVLEEDHSTVAARRTRGRHPSNGVGKRVAERRRGRGRRRRGRRLRRCGL